MTIKPAFAVLAAFTLVSCSGGPAQPSATSPEATRAILGSGSDSVGATAISTTRMRLRRVGVGDIQTGLVTGQVISVPVDVKLDVWAEIVRLETDRARLVVDWGNGNNDFAGCGSCRIENTYTAPGRYTLTAKVVDLNAPLGSELITSATVTINVVPPSIACASVGTDFEAASPGAPLPITIGGATYASAGGNVFDYGTAFLPTLLNQTVTGGALSTSIVFDSDKTLFSAGVAMNTGGTATYQALSSSGSVVASGTLSFGPSGAGVIGTTLTISAAPFRTVIVSYGGTSGWAIDNVSASCN